MHPVTLDELIWIDSQYGAHPALGGYTLGGDVPGAVYQMADTTQWLHQKPTRFDSLVEYFQRPGRRKSGHCRKSDFVLSGISQLYFSTLNLLKPRPQLYCNIVEELRSLGNQYDLLSWPMFNVSHIPYGGNPVVYPPLFVSDSLTRFQGLFIPGLWRQGLVLFHLCHLQRIGRSRRVIQ